MKTIQPHHDALPQATLTNQRTRWSQVRCAVIREASPANASLSVCCEGFVPHHATRSLHFASPHQGSRRLRQIRPSYIT
ncbi:hypothetical protein E2C01_066707 [Portunus trituberculatus]|uniref:Uncharacterized protein n=1 Tax=Portunus trituberculatus TaxID=210409 RepID=A0A5B7HM91_PORTR|nr:hypothetical protein [Portunus trituberculatus]